MDAILRRVAAQAPACCVAVITLPPLSENLDHHLNDKVSYLREWGIWKSGVGGCSPAALVGGCSPAVLPSSIHHAALSEWKSGPAP